MPAWVEHANGARDPLVPGAALAATGPKIYTGPGARALLRLADGSLVKLGENGLLALDDLGQRKIKLKDVVTASLDVVSGAFRFTTQALYKIPRRARRQGQDRDHHRRHPRHRSVGQGRQDARHRVPDRGQDHRWCASTRRSRWTSRCRSTSRLKTSRRSRSRPVSKEQLDLWSLETEIAAGAGALRKGGKWRVYLADANNQDDALKAYDRLRNAGYAAEIRPVTAQPARTTACGYRILRANRKRPRSPAS